MSVLILFTDYFQTDWNEGIRSYSKLLKNRLGKDRLAVH